MAKQLSIETLKQLILDLRTELESLGKIVHQYERRIEALEKENLMLREKLAKYENTKNSNNSSIPPSKDENRPKRNQSLRKKTGRNPGGQKGRKGNTLKMIDNPDITKKHIPEYCSCCGKNIKDIPYKFIGKRQVIDIPEIKFETTEHQIYKRVCSCGHTTKSSYPTQTNAPVNYGNNIESLIGYFHTRQYVPFKRMQEIFHDIF